MIGTVVILTCQEGDKDTDTDMSEWLVQLSSLLVRRVTRIQTLSCQNDWYSCDSYLLWGWQGYRHWYVRMIGTVVILTCQEGNKDIDTDLSKRLVQLSSLLVRKVTRILTLTCQNDWCSCHPYLSRGYICYIKSLNLNSNLSITIWLL